MEEELYARIEDYLENVLSEPERLAFEAEVKADPSLADLLARMREARSSLSRQWAEEPAHQAIAATLQQVGDAYFKNNSSPADPSIRRRRMLRWWPALVAAAGLAGLLIWMLRPATEAGLYARYRRFPEADFVTRAAVDTTRANLAAASAAFNAGNYDEALARLQRHLSAQPDDLGARFFAALCQLELGRTAGAGSAFRQLRSAPTYADEADWYLALTFLKEKNFVQCREALRQIPVGSRHYEPAQELLGQLENSGLK